VSLELDTSLEPLIGNIVLTRNSRVMNADTLPALQAQSRADVDAFMTANCMNDVMSDNPSLMMLMFLVSQHIEHADIFDIKLLPRKSMNAKMVDPGR
jgi:hypothetical protein